MTRRAMRVVLLGIACCAGLAAAHARADDVIEDPASGVMTVVVRSGVLIYRLPHVFLVPDRDSVWTREGPLVRGTDYLVDPLRGELRLLRERVGNDTLRVSARWLLDPPPLELHLQSYRAPATADSDSTEHAEGARPLRPAVGRDPTTAPSGTSLTVNGNKTIAVDFGSSQDATLRQSLDLAVGGTLAPGVTLTGVLSDRNTPLTTEGSTQELQALDRVLIELKAPQGGAALGDIGFSLPTTDFARIERRLQGVRADWGVGGFHGAAAAASARGEYNRIQLFGVDGRQGPYQLTDRDGRTGVTIVAGSEVVTVDGARMVRGEAADYSIDYDLAQVTFSNRRPISSASRITIDYQFSVNEYRRNFAGFDGRWDHRAFWAATRVLTENDDRGRPLDFDFTDAQLATLRLAGDSLAIGPGVTPGPGDYDTVRVANVVHFAFAGPDSGHFALAFAPAGAGHGDYADSAVVSGRVIYRYVGPNAGSFVIGTALPLPESHVLWSLSAGAHAGPLAVEGEGALSRLDRNTFSSVDDQDNLGGAGRARVTLAGRTRGWLAGDTRLTASVRKIEPRFEPFERLEQPFAQEDWGLPITTDLDRQERGDVEASFRPKRGGELKALYGALRLPTGFESAREAVDWGAPGFVSTHFAWQHALGHDPNRAFSEGGRDLLAGELRLRFPWLEPAVRGTSDERRTPSDSAAAGQRYREVAAELATGAVVPWKALGGYGVRRDAAIAGGDFVDQSRVLTARGSLESPSGGRFGVALGLERRDVQPLANPTRTRSDLGSMRLRLDEGPRGTSGSLGLEITSEGQNRRIRTLTFVGAGQGAYDSFGNFVGAGQGDHDLITNLGGDLERIGRADLSARAAWAFGHTDALRGSRLEFNFESDARRAGNLNARDLVPPPTTVLADSGLVQGSVLQRLEGDLAPGSATSALHLRLERRVTADRSFENFGQTEDDRIGTLRWRARPAATVTTELEGRLKRQAATQSFLSGAAYAQTIEERGGSGQLVWTPDSRFRLAAAGDLAYARPAGATEFTRTLRVGPDIGWAFASRGRTDVTVRRGIVSGPPPVSLIPSADPAGAPEWEATGRVDYRVRDITSVGLTIATREFAGQRARTTGRVEVRAFF